MRTLLTFIVLGFLGYGVYWYYGEGAEPGEPLSQTDADALAEVPGSPGEAPESPAKTPPRPSDEKRLRDQMSKDGPRGEAARYDMARLIIRERKQPEERREGIQLLEGLFRDSDEYAAPAAAVLLGAAEAENRLRYASFLHKRGRSAPGYHRACALLGRSELEKPEDSAQVIGWELLSEAYFARDDERWRRSLRDDLDRLVNTLILSKRMTKACVAYTVQRGDYLAKIAKDQGTTVELLRWLNGLGSDTIHPGKRLKILTGAVTIEVKKSTFRLDALLDGKYLFSAPVGLGKEGTTPIGEFVVDVKQIDPAWQKVGQPIIDNDDPRNPLGARWLGFRNTTEHQGYGIHGTKDPETIGTESSEGCIRLSNENIVLLYRLVPRGTPVRVRE